jgi:hypothetical protein
VQHDQGDGDRGVAVLDGPGHAQQGHREQRGTGQAGDAVPEAGRQPLRERGRGDQGDGHDDAEVFRSGLDLLLTGIEVQARGSHTG